jgi:hypothetical protein
MKQIKKEESMECMKEITEITDVLTKQDDELENMTMEEAVAREQWYVDMMDRLGPIGTDLSKETFFMLEHHYSDFTSWAIAKFPNIEFNED